MARFHPTADNHLSRFMRKPLVLLQSLLIILAFIAFAGCKKDPGDGGNSVIKGTVLERNYTTFPSRYTEAGAKDADVYIIYGDGGNAFDDRTKTSFDGTYKFETLKKGNYRIYVYTDDTALTNFGNTTQIIKEIEIKKNQSDNEVPVITTISL